MSPLAALEPPSLWEHFDALTRIPRPSGHETGAAAYVAEVGRRIGAEVRRDAVGNVVLAVPASSGREKAPTVILQGHLDMVIERQHRLFALAGAVLERDFAFPAKDRARELFFALSEQFRNWNYAPDGSPAMHAAEAQIRLSLESAEGGA